LNFIDREKYSFLFHAEQHALTFTHLIPWRFLSHDEQGNAVFLTDNDMIRRNLMMIQCNNDK